MDWSILAAYASLVSHSLKLIWGFIIAGGVPNSAEIFNPVTSKTCPIGKTEVVRKYASFCNREVQSTDFRFIKTSRSQQVAFKIASIGEILWVKVEVMSQKQKRGFGLRTGCFVEEQMRLSPAKCLMGSQHSKQCQPVLYRRDTTFSAGDLKLERFYSWEAGQPCPPLKEWKRTALIPLQTLT